METTPSSVVRASGPKQGGEFRARWAWAEPSVWTERMLTALESGVKGGVWFSLMDKGRGRGTDHQRWPNQFFADHGLFCLTYAHGQFRQPPCW